MNIISDQESKSLTWIRVFAMFSIILCHLFQTYHKVGWSDVFNMGVQVFLVMSGFLYGHKQIDDWKKWAQKRINKIYLPYLVFLLMVLPLYILFHPEAIIWKAVPFYFINLQGFRFLWGGSFARIEGLRHVWFLTAIMCAYASTPILQRVKSNSGLALLFVFVLAGCSYLVFPTLRYTFVFSWVYLYAIGYLYVQLNPKLKHIFDGLCLVAIVVVLAVLKWDDLLHVYSFKYRVVHDLVGVFAVVWGVKLLSWVPNLKVPKIISLFDKYSFHVYLVHFIIMHGPFSMAQLTNHAWINITLMLFTTVLSTYLFVIVLGFINKQFGRLTKKKS